MFRYGQDGYFVNLKDYFADKEGKSKIFWDRLENELNAEDRTSVINAMTDPSDGSGIYAIPMIEVSTFDRQKYQTWINAEWLDKLNMDVPTDAESLYKFLKAVKENDCNGNGDPTDEIPLFGSQVGGLGTNVIDFLINLFVHFNDSRAYTVTEGDKLVATYTTDEYREAMKGIYSTSVNESTIDESPMAYRGIDDIHDTVEPTAEVVDIITPVYNFKASKSEVADDGEG